MIKIKDYIYNENYVEAIRYIKGNLYVELNTSVKYDMIKDATFEDIEWDYGNTELEELKLDYSAVVTGYKKLEEHNKELEEDNKFLREQRDNILNNAGKAANYIIDNCISEETGRISDPDILKIYKFLTGGAEPFIKRGEENE